MYALENLEQLQVKDDSGERITFKDEAVKTVRQILQLKQQKEKLLRQEKELDDQIKEAELRKHQCEKKNTSKKYKAALDKHHKLQQLLDCYRLTGLSLHSQDKDTFILRFDTNYKSKFYDSYYAELSKRHDDTYELKRHNLPKFMPVAKLKQYLKDDVPEFASKVSDYLYTYTTRREEVVQVQGLLPEDRLQVSMTDAADFVQISLGKLTSPLTVKVTLTYQDLLHVLPTRVTFHVFIDDVMEIPETFKEEQVLKWKQQLKMMPLSITMKAVSDAFQFVELENERNEREEEDDEEDDST